MRLAGRIIDWNDEKGFGFVIPNGGGDRTFVHVNEFQRGSRRPVTGDLISYLPSKDTRGRLQAREIRHAGQKKEQPRQPSRIPRAAIGIGALVAVVGIAAIAIIPFLMAGVYFTLSGVSYVMYLSDKAAAERDARRIPENSLHLADLLGGWPGALIAQQQFRHKTIKQPFQFIFWATVILNLAGAWWLVSSGTAFESEKSFNARLNSGSALMYEPIVKLAASKAASAAEADALEKVASFARRADEEERTFGDRINDNKSLRGEPLANPEVTL